VTAVAPRTYEPPGPGTWTLDAAHCPRPRSRYMHDLVGGMYAEGFRAGFAEYAAMTDTIEYAAVNGFVYTSVRPLGAPPGAEGPPPRIVLALLARLHPVLRQRVRRAALVIAERPWRAELARFTDAAPALERELLALGAERIDGLDLPGFLRHLDAADAMARRGIHEHFRQAAATMVPVGDFLAHVVEWTSCTAAEALGALRGSSPESLDAVREVEAVAAALRADPGARAVLDGEGAAADKLSMLRARPGRTGEAVTRWLDRFGHRIVTGIDVAERTALELPESLVATLVACDAAPAPAPAPGDAASLRARVPEGRRREFDDLLDEARAMYRLRDARCVYDFWRLGHLRRAVLEAGRRLVDAGKLERADHAVDLTGDEIASLLRGGEGPSATRTAEHASWRASASAHDAPEVLGPPRRPPPSFDWLPAPAARVHRALTTYVTAMREESTGGSDGALVNGVPASPGRYTGTARVLFEASDFERVRAGDVLVAPMTTAAYNMLLPLLGAIVTDRGGVLSHPAIVSREFGIPAVVGCRAATQRIPDGARVEVDGARGTVRVLG
jgi:pyruvate,water dikinase